MFPSIFFSKFQSYNNVIPGTLINKSQKYGYPMILLVLCVIAGFHDNCALLDCYAASSDNSLRTFMDNLSVSSLGFLTLEDGADRLSRNFGKELVLLVA